MDEGDERSVVVDGMLMIAPIVDAVIAAMEVELKALEITNLRMLDRCMKDAGYHEPRLSILKLQGTLVLQRLTELVAVLLRDAHHVADDPQRDGRGEVPRRARRVRLA